jgi:nucleoside-diphosphate-sugar epimerase
MSATVAITGAGGSLGQALTRRLVARGLSVKGLVRNPAAADALRSLGATPIIGDLREPASLQALVSDCEVVFHLAAWLSGKGGRRLAEAVNVVGTANVVQAAAQVGCRRLVHASSIAVYGPVAQGLVTEDTPIWSLGDPYGDTKIGAEAQASEHTARASIELTILRPTMIYGPASPSWTVIPFGAIGKGLPVILGDGQDLLDAIYVDDVALAFELAAFEPKAAGEAFNIGAGAVTWNEFMGAYGRMQGVRLHRLPAPVARAAARLAAGATRLFARQPLIVPELLNVLTSRATFSSEKARRLLGFQPQVDLAEGMRRTEAWLRQSGHLRRTRVALVTGAGGGLGQATARNLKAKGLTVWAADLPSTDLGALDTEGIHTLSMDVTSEASVAEAVRTVETAHGSIDLLVNIAGILKPGPLESQAMSDIQAHLEVNALGPLRTARAVAPLMRRQGYGRIVNVSSTNGFLVTPFMGAYSASKYALEALSDALRMELSPWGIRVTVIRPGSMKTTFAERAKLALRNEIERSGEHWRSYLEVFLNSWLWGVANATAPAKVADAIVRAGLAKHPSVRAYGTLDSIPPRLLQVLPDRLKDIVFAWASGLRRAPIPNPIAAPANRPERLEPGNATEPRVT